MNIILYKFLVILFLFIGESFYLYAEMLVAKNSLDSSSKVTVFAFAITMVVIGGLVFLGSVYFGMHLFKNIWIIAAISVAAIVVMEPILAFTFFKQLPTLKNAIGFALGVVGLIVTL